MQEQDDERNTTDIDKKVLKGEFHYSANEPKLNNLNQ